MKEKININVHPIISALSYISLILFIFLAPKFWPTIDKTAVFNPNIGRRKICSYLTAVPYPAIAKFPKLPIKNKIINVSK